MEMKKIFMGVAVAVLGLSSFGQGAVIDEAVSWLYNNGYTIFSTTRDYKPDNYMRRDEAAKFFVKIAGSLGDITYKKSISDCGFRDINQGHINLKNEIIESCRLGIFQGYGDKFMPDWAITQEQFNTLLVRTFDAIGDHVMNFLGTCGANEKYQYITTPLVPQQKITRGDVAELTYDIYQWNLGLENWILWGEHSNRNYDNCYGI